MLFLYTAVGTALRDTALTCHNDAPTDTKLVVIDIREFEELSRQQSISCPSSQSLASTSTCPEFPNIPSWKMEHLVLGLFLSVKWPCLEMILVKNFQSDASCEDSYVIHDKIDFILKCRIQDKRWI